MATVQVAYRFPPELKEAIEQATNACSPPRTMSWLVSEVMTDWCRQNGWLVDQRPALPKKAQL